MRVEVARFSVRLSILLVGTLSDTPSWSETDTAAWLDCSNQSPCSNYNISCPSTVSDCNVIVNSPSSCQNSFLNTAHNDLACDFSVTCGSSASCQNSFFFCPNDGTSCSMTCSQQSSCNSMHLSAIHSSSADLDLSCAATRACQQASVWCGSGGTCTIACTSNSACEGAKINEPTTSSSAMSDESDELDDDVSNDFSLTCSNRDSCLQSEVHCMQGSECDITCNGATSCDKANIYCNNANECNIDCDNTGSCQDASIYCSETLGTCTIDCSGDESNCSGLKVYCYESNDAFQNGADNNFCTIENCVASDLFDCSVTWIAGNEAVIPLETWEPIQTSPGSTADTNNNDAENTAEVPELSEVSQTDTDAENAEIDDMDTGAIGQILDDMDDNDAESQPMDPKSVDDDGGDLERQERTKPDGDDFESMTVVIVSSSVLGFLVIGTCVSWWILKRRREENLNKLSERPMRIIHGSGVGSGIMFNSDMSRIIPSLSKSEHAHVKPPKGLHLATASCSVNVVVSASAGASSAEATPRAVKPVDADLSNLKTKSLDDVHETEIEHGEQSDANNLNASQENITRMSLDSVVMHMHGLCESEEFDVSEIETGEFEKCEGQETKRRDEVQTMETIIEPGVSNSNSNTKGNIV